MRSTRSYLARPMSDISYVDEDTLSPTGYTGNTRHHHPRPSNSSAGSSNNSRGMTLRNQSSESAFIPVPVSTNNKDHLRVEQGSTYRAKQQKNRDSLHSRHSADAQTQSAESSFMVQQTLAEDNDQVVQHQQPCVQIVTSSPSPHTQQQPYAAVPPPRVASPVLMVSASPVPGQQASQPTQAVTVQHSGGALQTHLLPSPIYGFGYDPTYCQYLGQGVDGFQYELVRRPSIGPHNPPAAPVELLLPTQPSPVPTQQTHLRRASGGIPYLTANSMQGSFDSGGPPSSATAAPIFIQQPLSPRHLHQNPQQPSPYHQPQPRMQVAPDWAAVTAGQSNPANSAGPTNDIPKLIHETSI